MCKTTLIKLLIGDVEAEEGIIEVTDSYSYISQKEEYIGKYEENKVKKFLMHQVNMSKTIKMGDKNGKKNLDGNIKSIKSRIDHYR